MFAPVIWMSGYGTPLEPQASVFKANDYNGWASWHAHRKSVAQCFRRWLTTLPEV